MDQFEYLSVLISIIIGLGITHLLTGAGRFLGGPDAPRVFPVHVVWTVNLILYQAFFWWFTFKWAQQATWSFGLFVFILGYAILLFLLSVILYPVEIQPGFDFRDHFHRRRRWFFRLLAFTGLVDMFDTILKGDENVRQAGGLGVIVLLLNVGVPLVAANIERQRFHDVYSVAYGIALIAYILYAQGILGGA